VSPAAILLLGALLGVVTACDIPARQALLTEMVAREDLANAIALNSSLVNGARLLGPALAGLVLAWAGAGVCFLLNAVSFLAVLASLLAMHVVSRPPRVAGQPFWHGLHEGIVYAFGSSPIRSLLLLMAVVSMAGMSYSALLPVLAKDVLQGEAGLLGWLSAAAGVGALAAAVYLAARRSVLGLGRRLRWTPALLGLALIGLGVFDVSLWPSVWLAVPLLALAGFAVMLHMAATNTILQTIVTEDKRGRVMSLYTMAFMGMAPLGSLAAGLLAEYAGLTWALVLSGLVSLAGTVGFALAYPGVRLQLRPIYIRQGLLPETSASGIYPAVQPAQAPATMIAGDVSPLEVETPETLETPLKQGGP
jgi:MFS family permease